MNRNSATGETNCARSPVDIAAGQLARPPHQHRQGPPDLAFEMQHAVEQVVAEGARACGGRAPSGRRQWQ